MAAISRILNVLEYGAKSAANVFSPPPRAEGAGREDPVFRAAFGTETEDGHRMMMDRDILNILNLILLLGGGGTLVQGFDI